MRFFKHPIVTFLLGVAMTVAVVTAFEVARRSYDRRVTLFHDNDLTLTYARDGTMRFTVENAGDGTVIYEVIDFYPETFDPQVSHSDGVIRATFGEDIVEVKPTRIAVTYSPRYASP